MDKVTVIDGEPWKSRFVMSLVLLVIGILFAVGGRGSLNIVLMISGALITLASLIMMASQMRISNVPGIALCAIGFVLGIALIVAPNLFSGLMMVIMAAMLLVLGILLLLGAPSMGIVGLVMAALLVVMGVYALFNLDSTADVVMIIIGVFMALSGLVGMAGALNSRRRLFRTRSSNIIYFPSVDEMSLSWANGRIWRLAPSPPRGS